MNGEQSGGPAGTYRRLLWFSQSAQPARHDVRTMPEILKVTINVFYS
jgi:hypothetical protein